DAYQGDLAGILADFLEQEVNASWMRLGRGTGFGPARLCEPKLGLGVDALGYWDRRAAGLGEEAVDQTGAEFGVAPSGRDAHDVNFGAVEGEAQGKGVVEVVADVGVDDNFSFGGGGRRGLGGSGAGGGRAKDGHDGDGDPFADVEITKGHSHKQECATLAPGWKPVNLVGSAIR